MNGIEEILKSGRFPGFTVKSGFTEQRQLENENAREILKTCYQIEEKEGSRFREGLTMSPNLIKEVWQNEISDGRKNSITERYDERIKRAEEKAHKLDND
jgi:hypothetical protein